MTAQRGFRWVRVVGIALAVFPLTTSWSTADELVDTVELAFTGGVVDGPGLAGYAPTVGVALETGPRLLRLTASGSWSKLTKTGTPGGTQVGGQLGAKIYLRCFFVTGGYTHSFTDQEVWTKTVEYIYAGGGFRWAGKTRNNGRAQVLNQVAFTVFREAYSSYANDTTIYRGSYVLDRRLGTGPWCVRGQFSLGVMHFNDNPYPGAERRQGMSMSAGIGISFRP